MVGIGIGWIPWWNREVLAHLDRRDRSLGRDRFGLGLNLEIEKRMRLLSAMVGGDELVKLWPWRFRRTAQF